MTGACERRLARALVAAAGPAELVAAESREWLSATFAGLAHRVGLVVPKDAAARLADLPPERLHVPGQVVADLAIVATVPAGPAGVRLTLDVLTVLSA